MSSLNRVILIGRLGAAPERKPNSSGQVLAVMRVATDRYTREGRAEEPDWHRVVTWGKTAESCLQHLDVGRLVAVEGQLRTRSWKDETGAPHALTEVVAARVAFLGGRPPAPGASGAGAPGGGDRPSLEEPHEDALPF